VIQFGSLLFICKTAKEIRLQGGRSAVQPPHR